uniref:Uncharacterized protein n=1 Tax=Rhipicephalus microplus TaxID=6941 RepID=A0A6G5AI89_RHIMP
MHWDRIGPLLSFPSFMPSSNRCLVMNLRTALRNLSLKFKMRTCAQGVMIWCAIRELLSVAHSAAGDAVILLQRYFRQDGSTKFLPSPSAMYSYCVRKCLNKAKQIVITSFFSESAILETFFF